MGTVRRIDDSSSSSVVTSFETATHAGAHMQTRETATLSKIFHIAIPKAVRNARNWRAGQEFAFIPKGDGVLLVPVPDQDALAGMAKGASSEGYRDRSDRT